MSETWVIFLTILTNHLFVITFVFVAPSNTLFHEKRLSRQQTLILCQKIKHSNSPFGKTITIIYNIMLFIYITSYYFGSVSELFYADKGSLAVAWSRSGDILQLSSIRTDPPQTHTHITADHSITNFLYTHAVSVSTPVEEEKELYSSYIHLSTSEIPLCI